MSPSLFGHVRSFTIFLSFSESLCVVEMSSPSSLSDSVILNKFNWIVPPPEIPEPPPLASMFDQASVVKWINTIPKDGDVRNSALKVFLNGVEREAPTSQYNNARGDYAAIMLELDHIQGFMSTSRKNLVESSKHVFSYDNFGKLNTNSFDFNLAVSDVGVAIHIQSLMIKFRDELVNPGPLFKFISDHKWWIVGGVVGVVTIYAIWKIM